MKKKKPKAPNTISGQFAPRLIEMLRSPAFRALSLSARRILDRIEIELASHGGRDNGKLPVTYANFVEFGVHRLAIAPGIREAGALGLLEVTSVDVPAMVNFAGRRFSGSRTCRHTGRARRTNGGE